MKGRWKKIFTFLITANVCWRPRPRFLGGRVKIWRGPKKVSTHFEFTIGLTNAEFVTRKTLWRYQPQLTNKKGAG